MTPTLHTPRLLVRCATAALLRAEMEDPDRFALLLGAVVPPGWPPETLADARPWFLEQHRDAEEADPGGTPWYAWYGLAQDGAGRRVLVASVGFKGAPDLAGRVEIGYSVLPQYQGRGYATEMVDALAAWALAQHGVRQVVAETVPSNAASQAVLRKAGFVAVGRGSEPGSLGFERRR